MFIKRGASHAFFLFLTMNRLSSLIVPLFLLLLLAGCSLTRVSTDGLPGPAPDYRLIYFIHGDANYTYHLNGQARQADEEALREAKRVAEQAHRGEVFIFHQKEETRNFLFFPNKDRVMYHYKNGRLLNRRSYSPEGAGLVREAGLYHRFRSPTDSLSRQVVFYFGHEIPAEKELTYHRTNKQPYFNIQTFGQDLRLFSDRTDLTVLSTCNNGNPLMAETLRGFSETMVASPRNLHLSHLSSAPVLQLEADPEITGRELAVHIADSSFRKLDSYLQTMVTVGVYDLEETGDSLSEASSRYLNHLKSFRSESLFEDNADCADLPGIREFIPVNGTKLWYKAPAFGPDARKDSHSAWGCRTSED